MLQLQIVTCGVERLDVGRPPPGMVPLTGNEITRLLAAPAGKDIQYGLR
jgi:hypothetical protein